MNTYINNELKREKVPTKYKFLLVTFFVKY